MNILVRYTKYSFSRVVVPINQKIKVAKKKHSDLSELKKQLNLYQTKRKNDPSTLYDQIPHRQVYKYMDSSFNNFFRKRDYTIQNFNFLLNIIGEQNKIEQIPKILQKMQTLQIIPNQSTYNYIIRAFSRNGNIQEVEKYFKIYQTKHQPNKFIYTSLMLAYVNAKNCLMADSILFQMIQQKLVPDIVTFTTLMNSHLKSRNLPKCWEIHKIVQKQEIPMDQPYISVLMQVYAASHDTEKAIKLYNQHIANAQTTPYIQTINSYLKALSARIQYSDKAIATFFARVQIGELINIGTCLYALKACAMTANLKNAIQITKIMKMKNIEPNKYIYNTFLRCYAAVLAIPKLSLQLTEVYINDAWKLLEQIGRKNMIDTGILNNFVYIFVQAMRIEQLEGLVLPLFDKYKIQKDQYTYDYLLRAFSQKQDLNTFMRIWEIQKSQLDQKKEKFLKQYGEEKLNLELKKQTFRPTFNSICLYLETGIKLMDMNQVIAGLRMFKSMDRMPKIRYLKFLGELKNLPEEIQAELLDFQLKWGKIRGKTKKNQKYQDPQNR